MTLAEYQSAAHRTSSFRTTLHSQALTEAHIQCCALGLTGEAGEIADHIKKAFYQGHVLSNEKLLEELGDVLWYVAEACTALGLSLEEVAAHNISKLNLRYGERFTMDASITRS